eukprot:g2233.t1
MGNSNIKALAGDYDAIYIRGQDGRGGWSTAMHIQLKLLENGTFVYIESGFANANRKTGPRKRKRMKYNRFPLSHAKTAPTVGMALGRAAIASAGGSSLVVVGSRVASVFGQGFVISCSPTVVEVQLCYGSRAYLQPESVRALTTSKENEFDAVFVEPPSREEDSISRKTDSSSTPKRDNTFEKIRRISSSSSSLSSPRIQQILFGSLPTNENVNGTTGAPVNAPKLMSAGRFAGISNRIRLLVNVREGTAELQSRGESFTKLGLDCTREAEKVMEFRWHDQPPFAGVLQESLCALRPPFRINIRVSDRGTSLTYRKGRLAVRLYRSGTKKHEKWVRCMWNKLEQLTGVRLQETARPIIQQLTVPAAIKHYQELDHSMAVYDPSDQDIVGLLRQQREIEHVREMEMTLGQAPSDDVEELKYLEGSPPTGLLIKNLDKGGELTSVSDLCTGLATLEGLDKGPLPPIIRPKPLTHVNVLLGKKNSKKNLVRKQNSTKSGFDAPLLDAPPSPFDSVGWEWTTNTAVSNTNLNPTGQNLSHNPFEFNQRDMQNSSLHTDKRDHYHRSYSDSSLTSSYSPAFKNENGMEKFNGDAIGALRRRASSISETDFVSSDYDSMSSNIDGENSTSFFGGAKKSLQFGMGGFLFRGVGNGSCGNCETLSQIFGGGGESGKGGGILKSTYKGILGGADAMVGVVSGVVSRAAAIPGGLMVKSPLSSPTSSPTSKSFNTIDDEDGETQDRFSSKFDEASSLKGRSKSLDSNCYKPSLAAEEEEIRKGKQTIFIGDKLEELEELNETWLMLLTEEEREAFENYKEDLLTPFHGCGQLSSAEMALPIFMSAFRLLSGSFFGFKVANIDDSRPTIEAGRCLLVAADDDKASWWTVECMNSIMHGDVVNEVDSWHWLRATYIHWRSAGFEADFSVPGLLSDKIRFQE